MWLICSEIGYRGQANGSDGIASSLQGSAISRAEYESRESRFVLVTSSDGVMDSGSPAPLVMAEMPQYYTTVCIAASMVFTKYIKWPRIFS